MTHGIGICYNHLTLIYEPCHDKTGLQVFGPGQTQTGLYSHIDDGLVLEISDWGCIIYVVKTKALVSFTVR